MVNSWVLTQTENDNALSLRAQRDLILNERSEYENQSILALRQSLGHDIL